MQAPITPTAITLADGRERVLRFSNAALKTIKEKYGVSIIRDGPAKLFQSVDETQLAELLVLGLDHNRDGGEPGISVEKIDELLDAQNATDACKQVFQALGASILKNALDFANASIEKLKADQAAKLKAASQPATAAAPAISEPPTVM